MTKTKSILKYLLFNSVFATCIYFGAIQGILGFMNILTFFIWVLFILFILGSFSEESKIKVYESEEKKFKLGIFGHMITVVYVGVLVYYGHILLGSIYLITVFLGYCMVASGKKLVEGGEE
jgi:hypothetical protein